MTNTTPQGSEASLRPRFLNDRNVHRLFGATQRNYVREVARFANWLSRQPDLATDEDLDRYVPRRYRSRGQTALGRERVGAAR